MANKEPKAPADTAGDTPLATALPMAWVKVSHHSPDHIASRYLYAGYGSNLCLEQMTKRCPAAELVGAGILRNAKLVFAYHLGIVPDDAATVPVGVFKLTAADVAALDRYEALPRLYERILVTVECNGQAVRCFTYLKRDNALEAPSEAYYATCLQGYNDWAFDSRRLRHARAAALKEGRPTRPPRGKAARFPASDSGDSEPIGTGTAEYWRTTRPLERVRSPRPEGGRLGGAEYIASLKADGLAMAMAKHKHKRHSSGGIDGAKATGRDGKQWCATRGADGHLVWKRMD